MNPISEDEIWETSIPMIQEESSKVSKYNLPHITIKDWNHKGDLNDAVTPRVGHTYHHHRASTDIIDSNYSNMKTESPYIEKHEEKKNLMAKLKGVFTGKKGGFSIYDENKGINYVAIVSIVLIIIIIFIIILYVTGVLNPSVSGFVVDVNSNQKLGNGMPDIPDTPINKKASGWRVSGFVVDTKSDTKLGNSIPDVPATPINKYHGSGRVSMFVTNKKSDFGLNINSDNGIPNIPRIPINKGSNGNWILSTH
jgi:hypothetical protein